MATVYAIANQKGGVGKTTTAVNVGACIAEAGYATLLVDVDPQANATVGLGIPRTQTPGLYEVLTGQAMASQAITAASVPDLQVLPAGAGLAGANVELPRMAGFEQRLRECLEPIRARFEYILLDCPPSLGPLTVSALVAADSVIVPVQTEYFALEGLAGLLDTLALVRRELNPRLTVAGMLLTMHDSRTRLGRDVEREVRAHFPDLVYSTVIPRNVRIGEAPSHGLPVTHHDPHSEATREDELRELPVELIAPNPNQPRRRFDEDGLQALAVSLGERGVLQPVLVRPRADGSYELVAGERHWRAARIAGLAAIPAIVRAREDAEVLELALIENMAREDLNPIEQAHACAALVEELGLTREEVGRRLGRSRVAVSNLVRLLELPQDAIELLQQGALSEGHGRALLLAEDHEERRRLARSAAREAWSVRLTEARARQSNADGGAGDDGPRRARGVAHPDQEQAALEIADALGSALGAEVRVKPTRRGYRAELSFATPEDALELARRLRPRAVA
jgi:ParB/RepB/Spo0J family partition protein